jgi:UDP-N-acetylmuramoylalanine--D-glutamate ligase
VVAYGEAGDLIVRDLGSQLDVVSGGTFEDVLAQARRLARPGDAVLLSPACSSYDMFANYEERGERFRQAVLAL